MSTRPDDLATGAPLPPNACRCHPSPQYCAWAVEAIRQHELKHDGDGWYRASAPLRRLSFRAIYYGLGTQGGVVYLPDCPDCGGELPSPEAQADGG